jgi:NTP pyrophosphatase (non-canonical NTP hydrolase)
LERTEDQSSVSEWGEQTFGPVTGPEVLAARAELEMAELREAVRSGNREDIALETADILILLYRLGTQFGFDIDAAVARKMQINRQRL